MSESRRELTEEERAAERAADRSAWAPNMTCEEIRAYGRSMWEAGREFEAVRVVPLSSEPDARMEKLREWLLADSLDWDAIEAARTGHPPVRPVVEASGECQDCGMRYPAHADECPGVAGPGGSLLTVRPTRPVEARGERGAASGLVQRLYEERNRNCEIAVGLAERIRRERDDYGAYVRAMDELVGDDDAEVDTYLAASTRVPDDETVNVLSAVLTALEAHAPEDGPLRPEATIDAGRKALERARSTRVPDEARTDGWVDASYVRTALAMMVGSSFTGSAYYAICRKLEDGLAASRVPSAPGDLRGSLVGLVEWMKHGLDLSDEAFGSATTDEVVRCSRPAYIWRSGLAVLAVAERRLALPSLSSAPERLQEVASILAGPLDQLTDDGPIMTQARRIDALYSAPPSAPEQRQAALLGLGALYDGNALDARRLTLFYPTGGAPEQVEGARKGLRIALDRFDREITHADNDEKFPVEGRLLHVVAQQARAVLDAVPGPPDERLLELATAVHRLNVDWTHLRTDCGDMKCLGDCRYVQNIDRILNEVLGIERSEAPSGPPESDEPKPASEINTTSDTAAQIVKAVGPPTAVTLYFCLSCGHEVRGNYNLDEGREKCSKTWHKDAAYGVRYVRAATSEELP